MCISSVPHNRKNETNDDPSVRQPAQASINSETTPLLSDRTTNPPQAATGAPHPLGNSYNQDVERMKSI
jgi:hypothetical protein